MKKLLVFVLGIMLVAGAFSAVYASDGGMDSVRSAVEGSKIVIGGDYRVRGVCKDNFDWNDDVDDDDCSWDQRLRLKVTAQITGGVEVRARLEAGDIEWGTGDDTQFGSHENSDVVTDYAYVHLPIGPVMVDAGQQIYSWGNKFLVWDTRVDRLAISAMAGSTSVGVFGDKIEENNGNEGFLDDDVDQYGLHAVVNMNDVEAGGLIVFLRDETPTDQDGVYGDIYVNAVASGVKVMGEFAMSGGDAFETAEPESDNPWGLFLSGEMAMDALTFNLLGAVSQNEYVADTHFTPTVFIGTDNPSAMQDFGDDGDTILIAGTVGFAATPELDVYGRLAWMDVEDYPSGNDLYSAFEADAGLAYQVATNTRYTLDFGYLSPDPEDGNAPDDGAIAVTSKLEVYF